MKFIPAIGMGIDSHIAPFLRKLLKKWVSINKQVTPTLARNIFGNFFSCFSIVLMKRDALGGDFVEKEKNGANGAQSAPFSISISPIHDNMKRPSKTKTFILAITQRK